ncbi:hypothetical protein PsAD2_04424 [Pseudovibrio axinellae]|uniref:Uncharacterized protein n=1 Tax=Pseudovibrio axinellae TaxID=989403 RepID=A0A165T6E3_9HYPH|nr:hypothetical protein [Pseudovibrio axinellae]KZL05499.1 hypothetical protein PsAD2_04424 [Pseudovibrio axinellae]SEP96590.1 hypothetical protein SAMN05421798_101833 [Pseudovibrio axinellae]
MFDLASQPQSAWQSYVSECVPPSLREAVAHIADDFTADYLLDCLILEKGLHSRLLANCTRQTSIALTMEERTDRFAVLLRLWAEGCHTVVDERLFADTARRRPEELEALREHLRQNALRLKTSSRR